MADQPISARPVLPGGLTPNALANVTSKFAELYGVWKQVAEEHPESVESAYLVEWVALSYLSHRRVLDATLDYLVEGDDDVARGEYNGL